MYYENTDTPAMARTSNLNEELGQVRFTLLLYEWHLEHFYNIYSFSIFKLSLFPLKYLDILSKSLDLTDQHSNFIYKLTRKAFKYYKNSSFLVKVISWFENTSSIMQETRVK